MDRVAYVSFVLMIIVSILTGFVENDKFTATCYAGLGIGMIVACGVIIARHCYAAWKEFHRK